MQNRQLNDAITVQNCILVLAFATTNYYLTPLFFLMLFLDYNNNLSTLIMFKDVGPSPSDFPSTVEPPTNATEPFDHAFPPNGSTGPLDHAFPPNGQNKNCPTIDLGYKIIPNTVQGVHVAIYHRLQASGERLVELFRTTPLGLRGPNLQLVR